MGPAPVAGHLRHRLALFMSSCTPPPSLGCLGRAAGLGLALLTLGWLAYLAAAPLDPALRGLDAVFRRLATGGLALAWVAFLTAYGAGTVVRAWQKHARRRARHGVVVEHKDPEHGQ